MIPKFRAFYKANQKMYEVLTLDIIDKKALIENNNNPKVPLRGYAKMSEIELMQSTGLFDKNGVEIYEGDIVKYNLASLNKTIKGFVVFERGGYFIMTDGYNENINLFDKPKHLIEILGNIYENLELLEVEE